MKSILTISRYSIQICVNNNKSIKRIRLMSSNNNSSKININDEHLRKAQATEIFRSSYYDYSKSNNNSISVSDLDDLVSDLRVRPSILIPSYELLGKSIGLLSKLAPKSFSKVIDEIIEEATTQQFNDSLRSLVGTDANDDIKITLKIHRDFNNTNINNDDNNNNNNSSSSSSSSSKICSGTLYHVLKLSQYT